MKRLLSLSLLLVISLSAHEFDEYQEFAQQSKTLIDLEAEGFIQDLKEQAAIKKKKKCNCPDKKCEKMTAKKIEVNSNESGSHTLKIALSFAAPLETWKEYSAVLEQLGGSFILRGLPENSFQQLSEKIQKLRDEGVVAPISIDPDLFERLNIEAVPVLILEDKGQVDRLNGNFSLKYGLELFTEKGDCKDAAKTLLQRLS